MQEEKITAERLMELGERRLERDELDEAIHYYNAALKESPSPHAAYLRLAEAYSRKARKGERVFYVLAMESLRGAIKAEPSAEDAHYKLIAIAMKTGKLGDLAVEYREKLKNAPAGKEKEFETYLKRIYLLSLLENDVKVPPVRHKPLLFVKVFFDCILLPFGTAIILTANILPKARPSLGIGIFIFGCYAVYRLLVYFFSRR
ncbi:MAG: hypothetical protein A2X34_06655 [Elusimicrobia bacterium GWC2_51_8]|nr:MAG: hypothetical protein A2X33_05065 [Elusimicrobia bacterium GWA2_51_34]OGR63851.1 MAG: hypothetical protein A2X34_06655 [Elusimicrobia bacterium GWC2_51_8]OGR87388.1 MAG: hypothetical protein A2021_02120 [Elusimicrobia bacterium GWF2_52_66]HAF95697.1 hypothetical protein [Elusimicrobiota bacterium]HCE97396.1 hypothetical protein [Elusimicrobiota bacterium]